MSKLYNLVWDKPEHVIGRFTMVANELAKDTRLTGNATKVYLILAQLAPLKMYITQGMVGTIAGLSVGGVSAAFKCLYKNGWLEKETQTYNGKSHTKYLLHFLSVTAQAATAQVQEQEQEGEPPQWQESIGGGFDSLHQGQEEVPEEQIYSIAQALFEAHRAGLRGEKLEMFQQYLETLSKKGIELDRAKIDILINDFLVSRDFHSSGVMMK